MHPRQQQIINNLLARIEKCEGNIPENYWCPTCIATATRCYRLFVRFERMNAMRKPVAKPYQWNSFAKHPGFNDPNST